MLENPSPDIMMVAAPGQNAEAAEVTTPKPEMTFTPPVLDRQNSGINAKEEPVLS
jgi:hypothetical protein